MDQGREKELLNLTQRLLAEKAILIDTIKSYVLTQRTLNKESKYNNTTSPCNDDRRINTNEAGHQNIERGNKINNKAVMLCRRLVQEKEVLVSQVEKLANKLTVQQQNLVTLQTNAKIKITQLSDEVKKLKKENMKSAKVHKMISSELAKSRAMSRHLRRAVVQYHSNKDSKSMPQTEFQDDNVNETEDDIRNSKEYNSNKDVMENVNDDDLNISLSLPSRKVLSAYTSSHSSAVFLPKKEKAIKENKQIENDNNNEKVMKNASRNGDDNDDQQSLTVKHTEENITSLNNPKTVTHTIHIKNQQSEQQHNEILATNNNYNDSDGDTYDDDIPPPPSMPSHYKNENLNLEIGTQAFSGNKAIGTRDRDRSDAEKIAVAQMVEKVGINNKAHLVAKQVSINDNILLQNKESSLPVAKIILTNDATGNDKDQILTKLQRRTSSSVQLELDNNAKFSVAINCIQHVQEGELLTKYASSSSVRSMIRQGMNNIATEKWVLVDQADGNLKWGSAKSRFTMKMSKVLKLQLITGVYTAAPTKKSAATIQRSNWHHSFTIETDSRTYMFVCPSMLSAATWIFGLQNVLLEAGSNITSSNHRIFDSRGQVLIHLLKVYLDTKALKRQVTRASLIIDAVNLTVLDKLSGMFAGSYSNDMVDSRMNAILNLPSVPTTF